MLKAGQLILLVNPKGKRYLRMLKAGEEIHTHDGMLLTDNIAAAGYGKVVETHLGHKYQILKPTIYDVIKGLKRQTQIMYPKEIGYLLLKLGIGPGTRVVESGSGSGGLTTALAYYVGETGKVYTHEKRPEFYKLVRSNLEWAGLEDRVEQFNLNIEDGFLASDCDALFLDVPNPWEYLHHIPKAVIPGAMCGFLLPTTNQVSDLLKAMEELPFEEIEVCEILVRNYKPVAERLRPEDRMVAHTGYLVFARNMHGCEMSVEAPKKKRENRGKPAADKYHVERKDMIHAKQETPDTEEQDFETPADEESAE
ncbi:tRNA (adenine-N1)-methyltransferase [Maridesulfovibrio sp. FT414]|uniref:tRNA (adenine-N1)-methyltransferase n=1 Tax=Maridesulfovibrio sp. FT414 TaxID=2979469 RepID=UPI003D807FA8